MLNSSFLFVVLLLVGGIQINGKNILLSIRLDAAKKKSSLKTIVRTDIKGRLLTPEEGCGYSKVANPRIVGGGPAKKGAWPWMALLLERVFGVFTNALKCGGSLITSRHVLTAAHCFAINFNFVHLGEFDTWDAEHEGREEIAIARKMPHEKYDDNLTINDIAIVELIRDVTFNDQISPICLPDNDVIKKRSFLGSNPFVTGWGFLKETDKQMHNVLQQVQLPIITNAKCKEMYKKSHAYKDDIQFSDVVLCAGFTEGGKDSCKGDSGGPMMLPLKNENGPFSFYQIGVVSYGDGCARPNIPGVYTNVSNYMDWIKSKLQ